MFRIGIIGAENSHSMQIGKLLNVGRKIPGARAVAIWGETSKLAKVRSRETDISTIVKDPKDMLGLVDGVMVDHRHGKYHLPAVRPFLRAGIPMFVDKPFCCRLAEGKRFLREARAKKVTVISFSTLKLTQDWTQFKRDGRKLGRALAVTGWGPCNIKGEKRYGGVFFYGCHQIQMLLDAFGKDVVEVNATMSGRNAVATLRFKSGLLATEYFMADGKYAFDICVKFEKGTIYRQIKSDADPYATGTKLWVKALRTGKVPFSAEDMLTPVAVLEAIEKSLATGKAVRVRKASL